MNPEIEKQIQEKGLNAPRVTPADIANSIAVEYYFTADEPFGEDAHPSLSLLTFCVLVLKNGFTVTGESACASPENFNTELGKQIAYKKRLRKSGYCLGTVCEKNCTWNQPPLRKTEKWKQKFTYR